jgi:photosystem II stability/assembly factor-like uncharacterized protein
LSGYLNRLRLAGAAALVLFIFVVGVIAQRVAPDQDSFPPPQPHELRPTHPPEPVVPLPPNTNVGEQIIPINSTTWAPFGPAPILNGPRPGNGPVSGRLTGIAAHPTDASTIYVAAAGGGVWKTTNGGSTWASLTDTQVTQSMGAIAIAPSNPNVIYAGTGEANNSGDSNFGRGVLISTNGGTAWTLSTAGGAFDRRTISEIAVDPTDATVAYAAVSGGGVNGVGGNNGIWKTTNTGATWTNTTTAITTAVAFSSVRIDPNNPATLYTAVGGFGASANGVYKTTNGGTNWSLLANAPNGTTTFRIVLAVAKTNSQVVYVSATSAATFGLLKFVRSDDGGATFTDLTAGTPNYLGGQGWYDTTLIVDPSNAAIVYAGGAAGSNSLIRSTNSGVNWTDIKQSAASPFDGPHVDHHASTFDANGNYLDGDDGGVYLLDTFSPVHWTHLNGNLNTIQFQGIALHPTDATIAFGGSQDNGTSKYSGTLGWTLVEGGDGGFVKFSQTNTNRIYHQAPVLSFGPSAFFRRSDNGGITWASKVSGITDNSDSLQNFYSPFVVDPGSGDRVLYGARHVWETTNGGDSWTAVGAVFPSNVTAIGVAPSDVNTIYAAAFSQTFFTSNHGTTWTLRNLPVTSTVRDIQVSSTNPLTAYAVVSNFSPGGTVFKTTNGGTTWTNVTSNLPNLPTWSLQIDSTTPGRLFVGNDDGVYVTTNDGGAWSRFGAGLPNAQVFQVELNTSLGILGAGTHGRGLWEISLLTPPTVVTGAASGVGFTTATLNGTANPNGASTTGQFQYGLTTSYGSTTPVQNLGSGSVAVAIGGGGLTGLTCNTPYHFRATATNMGGTTAGLDATFTTTACPPPPSVVTGVASGIFARGATLTGTANPNGAPTTAYFQYGLTTSYGSTTLAVNLGSGSAPVTIGNGAIAGLTCNTLYHFRAVATNAGGTTTGSDATFTTLTSPCVAVNGDFEGDGKAELTVWRAGDGTWYWLTSSSGYNYAAAGAKQWGAGSQSDKPLIGDIVGDG